MFLFKRFGSTTLPIGNINQTESPLPAQLEFVETTAGLFDNASWGRNRPATPFSLRYQAVVLESTMAATRTLLDTLRAQVGTRNFLYRERRDDGALHYCMARLSAMPFETDTKDKAWRTITLEFQQMSRWHGALHGTGWRFDTGIDFDDARVLDEDPPVTLNTNPKVITTVNNGNIPLRDVQLIFAIGATPITSMIITGPHIDLRFGAIPAASGLVLDAGAHTVLLNGDNYYSSLTRGPDHRLDGWIELGAGSTPLVIQRSGGAVTDKVAIIYTDAWA
jgi:hypothetical protein